MEQQRASGILLHPTSLSGKYGIGTLGKEAFAFVDFLKKAKQTYWQILPLGPTGYGDSPYQCFSSKAGNPFIIDFESLSKDGLLKEDDIPVSIVDDVRLNDEAGQETKINYGAVIEHAYKVLHIAKENFIPENDDAYHTFTEENKIWLDDYALFMALKERFDKGPWYEWEEPFKMKDENAIQEIKDELQGAIEFQKFIQYIFFKQWYALKKYANDNGIKIIGDIPIYVAMDSSDTWCNPTLFQFDEFKNPLCVGGCPPDYFSETGQMWGNPIFNYEEMEKDGYRWWIDRIKSSLDLYDLIRIDHFRGFAGYWSIPFGEETAINGKWIDGPGMKLFDAIKNELGDIPVIAEDLGLITPDVIELRDHFNLPGMKVLQFAFDSGETNDYIPHNYIKNCVVYTGTHDNETVNGWFEHAKEEDKKYILDYLHTDGENIVWDLIRCAWASVANTAIVPMQDLLNLGAEARMNLPGTTINNWQWRMLKDDINDTLADKLAHITLLFGRIGK
ncbi:MAG: 4-alpha-glucanotransferase [Chitinophagales bacterium]|nr:4-alpha-glucanotransferase [Chitinophagales bacterium]